MIRTGGAACRIRTPSWVPLLDQTLRALKERKAPTVILAPGLRSAPPAFAGGRKCLDNAREWNCSARKFCRKARRKCAHRPKGRVVCQPRKSLFKEGHYGTPPNG